MADETGTNSSDDGQDEALSPPDYFMRCSQVSILVIGIALLLLLAFIIYRGANNMDGSALRAALDWDFVALLGIAIFCIALPTIKSITLSKDGATVSIRQELGRIDNRVMVTTENLNKQLEGIIKNLNKLNLDEVKPGTLQPLAAAALVEQDTEVSSGIDAAPKELLTLRDAIKLLPAPTVENDPQKGRFGGKEDNGSRRLVAHLTKSNMGPRWRRVSFTLESTNGKPLTGRKAFFFLHDSFSPEAKDIDVPQDAMTVLLKPRQAYGAFTCGVLAENGKTRLEIDLQTTDSISDKIAPRDWRNR